MRGLRQMSRRRGGGDARQATYPTLDEVGSLMEYELARARRYERPLSLVAVPPAAVATPRFPLRFSDLFVAAPDRRAVVVMLPETTSDGATALARRLLSATGIDGDVRVAAFPEDGVTLDDLLRRVLDAERVPAVAQAS